MEKEKLFDLWANRNPNWEIKYEETILKTFCDYGKGSTLLQEARGKIFGAGYEIIIIAFFIGLYHNRRKELTPDTTKKKGLGQPITYWGNLDSKPGRTAYPEIRKYMFAALVARTDIDFIALDKGDITPRKVVDKLMTTMEEYINWGLDYMAEKMEDNPNYYFKETSFLREFMEFIAPDTSKDESSDDEPESLD